MPRNRQRKTNIGSFSENDMRAAVLLANDGKAFEKQQKRRVSHSRLCTDIRAGQRCSYVPKVQLPTNLYRRARRNTSRISAGILEDALWCYSSRLPTSG